MDYWVFSQKQHVSVFSLSNSYHLLPDPFLSFSQCDLVTFSCRSCDKKLIIDIFCVEMQLSCPSRLESVQPNDILKGIGM